MSTPGIKCFVDMNSGGLFCVFGHIAILFVCGGLLVM